MNVSLQTFGGLIPRLAPSLLPQTGATVANNCRLRSGKFAPLKQSGPVTDYPVRLENGLTDMADAKTIHLWKRGARKEFLAWPGHVTVAPSNIFDDDRYRMFVAGETGKHGTEVSIPEAPVMSPDGMFMTSQFVQVFDTRPTKCSTPTAAHRYLDGLSDVWGYMKFNAVENPADEGAAKRIVYKVVSVNGSTVVATTQPDWDQDAEVTGGFLEFRVDFNRFLDGAEVTFTIDTDLDPFERTEPEVSAGDPVPADYVQHAFVQTYKDSYGRESACSPLSNYVTYKDGESPAWETVAAAIASPPADAMIRTVYKVLGVYGDKLYATTNTAPFASGGWSQGLTGSSFAVMPIALDSSTEGEKLTLYFSEQFVNQPCVYVSAIDSGGFDRHSICLEPLPACGVTRHGGNITDLTNARYTFFYQTWVDEYGYESPVSESSAEVIYNDGDPMDITSVTPCPTGAVKRRVYKVVSGTETESIQFVWEQDVEPSGTEFASASSAFATKDENAAEILVPMTQCPKDLVWIVNIPGNFYAGFTSGKRREIVFSEIDIPTSYPLRYRYSIREDAVGLAVSGTTLFVMTVGQPYAISGTDPSSMTVSRIASNQGCVSRYSICTMNNAIFYASQDGVCMLSEGSQSEIVMTKDLFLKEQWQALNPSSCIMAAHDTALHMFFTKADGTRVSYILDLIDSPPTLTTHEDVASAVCADVESDGLYMIKGVSA